MKHGSDFQARAAELNSRLKEGPRRVCRLPKEVRKRNCRFCFRPFTPERSQYCSRSCASLSQCAAKRLGPVEFDIWRMMNDPDYCGPSPVPLSPWREIATMIPYEIEPRLIKTPPGTVHTWRIQNAQDALQAIYRKQGSGSTS